MTVSTLVPDTLPSSTKLPAEHVRQILTRDYSTIRFRIEYGNYLSNHLLHAVVALHELGASEQKITDYAAYYTQKLEAEGPDHEDVVEHATTTEIISDDEAQALLGKRQKYDALLAYYARDVKKLGVDDAVRKHLPNLYSGLSGALLHGIIQLGYAYYIGGDRLAAEGLAYQHHCYLSFEEPEMPPSKEPLRQFARQTVFEVADALTSSEFLRSEQDRIMATSPVKDLDIGWIQRGVNVFSGHPERNSPEAFALIWSHINEFDFSTFDGTYALDIVMWLYTMLKHNDFIILHAATSAWSLQQLEHLLSPSDKTKAWRVWLHVALTALVTARVHDFREEDICAPSSDLEARLAALPSWSQLREQALAIPGFPDEHVYKMVQVAEDHANTKCDNVNTFLSPTEREFVARSAALTVMTKPFKPYTHQPEEGSNMTKQEVDEGSYLKPGEVDAGTSIIAVRFKGGVVLGADSRTSTGTYVANRVSDKLTPLHDRLYCCRSGSAADTQALSDYVRYYLSSHSVELGRLPKVGTAANLFRSLCYHNKDRLLAGIIVAGWDPVKGGQVFSIPIGGAMVEQDFAIGGSGSTYIYGLVDAEYRPDMTKEECQQFVKKALAHAMARDGSSGGVIRTVTITENEVVRDFTCGDDLPFII
ncbi:Proteasome subunit beta type-6 [Phytophthora palmivora]|uniref:proteasome endopeptidase complex n=1 Tax=Phytophthora palmivora TaxID=4796 RepID=A0A2P4WYZ1_9STRA|nr:Proteasome subunit beta type-6 [Phytophthora palmivora]